MNARRLFLLTSVWEVVLGVTLLVQPSGFSSSSYAVMFALLPPAAHGTLYVVAGAIAAVAAFRERWEPVAVAAAASMTTFWTYCFVAAGVTGQLSGWSAPATYGFLAAFWMFSLFGGDRRGH